jgi:[ribosomal protein S5]-alanine N-acetyltransferase
MFPSLETERCFLQEIVPEDQQFIYEGLSHPRIIPFYGVRYESFEDTKKQMEWYEKSYAEDTGGPWKIIDKNSKEKIGVVAYYKHDKQHRKAEVGFWIFPQYWSKGIITECLEAVIDYCRKEKRIHRLEAFVENGNIASMKVLEKTGFAHEGQFRECEWKNEKFIDLQVFGLIL